MQTGIRKAVILSFVCALIGGCTPKPPLPEAKPVVEEQPATAAPQSVVSGKTGEAPVKPAVRGFAVSAKAGSAHPYVYTVVDSVSMGNEIVLSKDKILIEEENADKDTSGDTTPGGEVSSSRYKVSMGYRIQVYATTNFKDAEKKKNDLLSLIDDPIYVVYDPPYYKIRAGNFEKEEQAKNLKRVLEEMGNDAWVVQSKIRVRTQEATGNKRTR